MKEKKKIFVINNGSTSTKVALFENEEALIKRELSLDTSALNKFKTAMDQLEMRSSIVRDFLEEHGTNPEEFDIIVARGGALPPISGGAYRVNDLMIDVLKFAPMAQHASNLSCIIGAELGKPHDVPVIIYDAPGADEFDEAAKITGLPEVRIAPVSHVLNTRKVARETADAIGKSYEECRFIVAHLGGGISINVHREGRIVDSVYDDMGPMSPQRAGRIPTRFMVSLCYSGKYTKEEMKRRLTNEGGVRAYFGTQDLRKIEEMIENGNKEARTIYHAMAYQIAKGIGELSTVLCGEVDRIILTGGGSRGKMLTDWIRERVEFIAPVEIIPGEKEMEALALGGLRVLEGLEPAKEYDVLPPGYENREAFYRDFGLY